MNTEGKFLNILFYQDLSYGEILAGQPGAWQVKKQMFYMHAITKCQKGPSKQFTESVSFL